MPPGWYVRAATRHAERGALVKVYRLGDEDRILQYYPDRADRALASAPGHYFGPLPDPTETAGRSFALEVPPAPAAKGKKPAGRSRAANERTSERRKGDDVE